MLPACMWRQAERRPSGRREYDTLSMLHVALTCATHACPGLLTSEATRSDALATECSIQHAARWWCWWMAKAWCSFMPASKPGFSSVMLSSLVLHHTCVSVNQVPAPGQRRRDTLQRWS
jgi:hypothetical protein